jgi:hypothetical protein
MTDLVRREWFDASGTLLASVAYDRVCTDAERDAILAVFESVQRHAPVLIWCTGGSIDVECAETIDAAQLEQLPRRRFVIRVTGAWRK